MKETYLISKPETHDPLDLYDFISCINEVQSLYRGGFEKLSIKQIRYYLGYRWVRLHPLQQQHLAHLIDQQLVHPLRHLLRHLLKHLWHLVAHLQSSPCCLHFRYWQLIKSWKFGISFIAIIMFFLKIALVAVMIDNVSQVMQCLCFLSEIFFLCIEHREMPPPWKTLSRAVFDWLTSYRRGWECSRNENEV